MIHITTKRDHGLSFRHSYLEESEKGRRAKPKGGR
jgi:hypothetical protein